ncbi:MAG: glutaredoxin family protein [Thermoplasmata archaeon]
MEEAIKEVEGEKDEHEVVAYTLSTCGWCKKTKKLLKELGVKHKCIDIDLLWGNEGKKIREELAEYNPKMSAPTVVIDEGEEVIIGFDEEKIREVLEDDEE